MPQRISAGIVHKLPQNIRGVLVAHPKVLEKWEGLTPIMRNEWICWMEDAKKSETKAKRLERLQGDLLNGKKRPCCWPGCSHRAVK